MALERKKLFGCPSCGFRVNGVEDACPRCGAKFGEDARFDCPFCGETVTPSTKECPSCHTAYDAFVSEAEKRLTDESIDRLLTDIIEKESKRFKAEGKRLSCPKCNWMVDRTEQKCPRCGIVFSDVVAYQCPICAALVAADTEICGECKAVLVAEEEEAPQTEVAPVGRGAPEQEPVKVTTPASAEVPDHPEPEPKIVAKPAEKTVFVKPARAVMTEPKRVEEAPVRTTPPKKRVRRRRLKAKPQQ